MLIVVVASCWTDDTATKDRLDADALTRGTLVRKAWRTGVKRLSDGRCRRYVLNVTQTWLLWEFGWSVSSLLKGRRRRRRMTDLGRTDLAGYQQCMYCVPLA